MCTHLLHIAILNQICVSTYHAIFIFKKWNQVDALKTIRKSIVAKGGGALGYLGGRIRSLSKFVIKIPLKH